MCQPSTSLRRARVPRRLASYRPQLLSLEDRLPLGDALLSVALGPLLLGPGLTVAGPAAWSSEGITDAGTPAGHRPAQPTTASVAPDAGPVRLAHNFSMDFFAGAEDGRGTQGPPATPSSGPGGLPSREVARGSLPDGPLLAALASASAPFTGARPAPGSLFDRGGTGPAPVAVESGSGAGSSLTVAPGSSPAAARLSEPARLVVPAASEAQPTAGSAPVAGASADASGVRESYGRLPLSFEANQGQADAAVQFLARGPGYTVSLTATEAVFALMQSTPTASGGAGTHAAPLRGRAARGPSSLVATSPATEPPVVRMQLVGGNPAPHVLGRQQLPGKVNYIHGQDRAQWQTDVPTYAKVEYQQVYPGVNLVYYGNQQRLEYDFVVAPGADPGAITLAFAGADQVEVDAGGDLVLHAAGGQIRQHKPFLYQEINGVRQEVSGGYVLSDGQQASFDVGPYDAAQPLVIDPLLAYSTYFGGSGGDFANGIAVDADGNAYVTGATNSLGRWDTDAFVMKLDPTGSKLLYASYFDGYGFDDTGNGIAVDAKGNAYVTGSFGGLALTSQVFAAKLDVNGSALYFVSFGGEGGWGTDAGLRIRLRGDGSDGNAYLMGQTDLFGFPTTPGAYKREIAYGDLSEVFVAKLDAEGNFVYSTLLGTSSWDLGLDLAVDAAGNAYVAGETEGEDFPTTPGCFQSTLGGPPTIAGARDAFVTKLNPQGSALVYSTYLGGRDEDTAHGIALDAAGNAYVTGVTFEGLEPNNFPITPGAFQPTFGGGFYDAFVTKLNATGSALIYSSYLGGGGYGTAELGDNGIGIAVDVAGNAYVTGETVSVDFPTVNPFQARAAGATDAFIAKVNPAGTALVYSSYLGGKFSDTPVDIAVDAVGSAYVTGETGSADFPTTPGSYQPTYGGGNPNIYDVQDAFVTKIAG